MKTMTIGKRLAITGMTTGVLTLLLGLAALLGVGGMKSNIQSIVGDALPGISACSKVESDVLEARGEMFKHIGSTDSKDKEATEARIKEIRASMNGEMEEVRKAINSEEERQLNAKIAPLMDRYFDLWESEIQPLSAANKNEEAYRICREKLGPVSLDLRTALRAETDYNRKLGEHYSAAAAATSARVTLTTWIVLLAASLLGGGLMFYITRDINRQLTGATGELARGAEQVASAASQVSSLSQNLAQGASEQAASLQETTSSTEQIGATTRNNRDNARKASTLMEETAQHLADGNRKMDEMVASMQSISESSQKVSHIIKNIDEIAFQTNILALNAAVEAARAGEAGMGFAVVADEVRNLAQRCAVAAKDTTELIEEAINNTRMGNDKIGEVAKSLLSITSAAEQARVLVEEVSTASQEQSHGLDLIAKAMEQMDAVTQRTAASAEESASASEELSAQAVTMRGVVGGLERLVGAAV